ncbi:MAG: DUF1559 domain-containing protein [Planctomycetaceae bacterium]
MNEQSELPIADKPPIKVNPYRIKLRHVLYVAMLLIVSSLAFGSWLIFPGFPHRDITDFYRWMLSTFGLLPGVAVILFWTSVWAMGFRHDSLIKTVSGVIAIGFVILLIDVFRHHPSAREAARGPQCRNNLKQIGIALENYHTKYGSFPPAYIADEHGKPMHSWRVLILPFIDQKNLYDKYRFDEPWDSPANRQLAVWTPGTYRCPSTVIQKEHADLTSYLAVTGPQTVWPGDKSTKIDDILDGSKNTVQVIELPQREVHWMEPRDISFDDAVALLGSLDRRDENGRYFNGHLLSCANDVGQVKVFPHGLSAETWQALFTINADDPAPAISSFESRMSYNPYAKHRTIAWWSFFILALVPLLWLRSPGSSAVGRPSLSNPLR